MKTKQLVLPEGTKVPSHIAIIPDGNRRWARARGKDTLEGHKRGFEITTEIARASRELGVHTLSLWGFSTENWDRTEREINYLMMLYESLVDKHLKEAMKNGVRIFHLGRKDRLPISLLKKIADAEEKTRDNDKYVLNICLDYGGQNEILRAFKKIQDAGLKIQDEKEFEKYLDTAGQPYPYVDLIIRTSGEQRTSGMLLWQTAYAESYWENDHFPDFTPEKFKEAILDYSRRRRRFGGNDAEEHLRFSPVIVASLDAKMQRHIDAETVKKYVKEQYGLTKDLAKEAGGHLYKAFKFRERNEWQEAKMALKELYKLVKKNLGLAFEPEIVANIEVKMWQDPTEDNMKELLAEKYRFSTFQATKSAHLAMLAQQEVAIGNWGKAKDLFEKYYSALKERVA